MGASLKTPRRWLNYLADIDRPTRGFFRRRIRLAIRFPVRWEKKIEDRITPPCLLGRLCDCLEEQKIEVVRRIYSFNRSLSNTGRHHRSTTQYFPRGTKMGPNRRFPRKKGLRRKAEIPLNIAMVPKAGFEPARVSPPLRRRQGRWGLLT